jgi:phage-related protein (TIGR01555 family)
MLRLLSLFFAPAPAPSPPAPAPTALASGRRDALFNPLSGLGGSGDKGRAARPDVYAEPLTRGELLALYRDDGYARRIVDVFPQEGCRKGWRCDDSTAKSNVMEGEDRRLQTRARVRRAWAAARLLGGALILPVLDEEMPPELAGLPPEMARQRLARLPLDYSRIRSVRSLLVLGRREASAASWETDPASPDYGRPRTWWVSPVRGGATMEVHASRLLYFAGAPFPPGEDRIQDGFDDSALQVCWNQIRNKSSIDQVGATIAQQLTISVYRMADRAAAMGSDAANDIGDHLRTFAQTLGITGMAVLRGGEDAPNRDGFEVLNSPVTGFGDLDSAAKEALSAASEIPMVVLFSQATGGLDGSGGEQRDGWHETIAAKQDEELREPLTRLYRMLYRSKTGPTGGVEPTSWALEFSALDELSEQEEATLRKTVAETDEILIRSGVVTPDHVARSRYGETGWTFELLPVAAPPAPVIDPEVVAEAGANLGDNAPV